MSGCWSFISSTIVPQYSLTELLMWLQTIIDRSCQSILETADRESFEEHPPKMVICVDCS